ncbi:AIR carboxylase family protein, partial [Candidatus Woesearchaeota archaeon]|nr:AIR carboxylase family protein [Candidatus Woesearchaeota archaeon]
NFGGLDSMLSTLQMPPGIPVLAVGVDCAEEAAKAAAIIAKLREPPKLYKPKPHNIVHNAVSILVKNNINSAAEKAADVLKKLNVPYELSYVLQEGKINIRFVGLNEIRKISGNSSRNDSSSISNRSNSSSISNGSSLIINVPVVPAAEKTSAADAIKLLGIKTGLWVGLNRAENAAIAAAEIIGKEKELLEYRKEIAVAVLKADEEERGEKRERKE